MTFSASPKTAEENQTLKRICSYVSSPVLQTAMALAFQGMRLAISIWISDLLSSISEEEKAESCFICISVYHFLQLPWPEIADFHLIFTLWYQYITGMALSGL